MLHYSAKELLHRLSEVINHCKEEDFSKPLPELSRSTLGQHIRHILEFFLCLFDARNERVINYDTRKHDKFIETDRGLAMSVIGSIHEFLDNNPEDFEVSFEANYTLKSDVSEGMKSSFYRELAYSIEHAIHHMALIKVATTHTLDYIELPETFGVASSTVRYRKGSNA